MEELQRLLPIWPCWHWEQTQATPSEARPRIVVLLACAPPSAQQAGGENPLHRLLNEQCSFPLDANLNRNSFYCACGLVSNLGIYCGVCWGSNIKLWSLYSGVAWYRHG